jgi:hypothetical protein
MVVDPITVTAAAAVGVVAGGYFLVRGIIRLFRSSPVESPSQPISAADSTPPSTQQDEASTSKRIAGAVKRAAVRGAERTVATVRATRRNAVALGRRAFVVLRGAYRRVKAAWRELLHPFLLDEYNPRLRVAYIVTCDREVHFKPFLKITPRIRDAIPADLAGC